MYGQDYEFRGWLSIKEYRNRRPSEVFPPGLLSRPCQSRAGTDLAISPDARSQGSLVTVPPSARAVYRKPGRALRCSESTLQASVLGLFVHPSRHSFSRNIHEHPMLLPQLKQR